MSCLFPVIPAAIVAFLRFIQIAAGRLPCCKLLCLGLLYITIVQYKRSVVSCHALFEELSAWCKLNAQGPINFTVSG